MSPLVPALRLLPRALPVQSRAFHSPFVALSASNHFTTPSPNVAPVYEKQHDSGPEPHISSSGTRTYVVSEPDPSNTPYEVPSGAYPTSASYANHTAATQKEGGAGENGVVRNAELPGGVVRRAGSRSGFNFVATANPKQGKF